MEALTHNAILEPGQAANISIHSLVIILSWTADVDLDLLAFYKTKDGRTGGVFSKQYPGGNAGSLETFPFIELSCDDGLDCSCKEKEEMLRISELADMAEIYIVAVNYTDAATNTPSAFIDYDGAVMVINEHWEGIQTPLNSPEIGHAAVICKLEHSREEGAKLFNINRVMELNEFMTTIPGAEMFIRLKLTYMIREEGSGKETLNLQAFLAITAGNTCNTMPVAGVPRENVGVRRVRRLTS